MKALDRKTLPYSVEQGGEYFDWNAALDDPDCDWVAMRGLSSHWVTCACGNLCAAFQRDTDGMPTDDLLWNLGAEFYVEVSNEDRISAKQILAKIEARSAELLAEMGIA